MLPTIGKRLESLWLDPDFDRIFFNERVNGYYPSLDIKEDKDNVYIKADLPGFKKEDIKIKVKDNVLSISGG